MTKEQFIQLLTEELQLHFPQDEYIIEPDIFIKNNDTRRTGIVIRKNDNIIAPTIYVENFYEDYLQKKITLKEIGIRIYNLYSKFQEKSQYYQSFSLNLENCKSQITYRLISQKHNTDFLINVPHISFLNLAITFHIIYKCTSEGLETVCITKQIQDKWGISTEELYEFAKINTPRILPAKIETMQHVIGNYLGVSLSDEEHPPVFIISNEFGINGATVMIYPEFIQAFAEENECNFFIIPSSIHEILVVPKKNEDKESVENEDSIEESMKVLSEMTKSINETHVLADEVLSDSVYYYNREEKMFLQ